MNLLIITQGSSLITGCFIAIVWSSSNLHSSYCLLTHSHTKCFSEDNFSLSQAYLSLVASFLGFNISRCIRFGKCLFSFFLFCFSTLKLQKYFVDFTRFSNGIRGIWVSFLHEMKWVIWFYYLAFSGNIWFYHLLIIGLALAQHKEGTFIHEEICRVNFNDQEWKCGEASNKTATWLNRLTKRVQFHLALKLDFSLVFKQQKDMNVLSLNVTWYHSEIKNRD